MQGCNFGVPIYQFFATENAPKIATENGPKIATENAPKIATENAPKSATKMHQEGGECPPKKLVSAHPKKWNFGDPKIGCHAIWSGFYKPFWAKIEKIRRRHRPKKCDFGLPKSATFGPQKSGFWYPNWLDLGTPKPPISKSKILESRRPESLPRDVKNDQFWWPKVVGLSRLPGPQLHRELESKLDLKKWKLQNEIWQHSIWEQLCERPTAITPKRTT